LLQHISPSDEKLRKQGEKDRKQRKGGGVFAKNFLLTGGKRGDQKRNRVILGKLRLLKGKTRKVAKGQPGRKKSQTALPQNQNKEEIVL